MGRVMMSFPGGGNFTAGHILTWVHAPCAQMPIANLAHVMNHGHDKLLTSGVEITSSAAKVEHFVHMG